MINSKRRIWRSGKTEPIYIPIAIAEKVLAYARGLDDAFSTGLPQATKEQIESGDTEQSFTRNSPHRQVNVFFDDCCCFEEGSSISFYDLHKAYQCYCRKRFVIPMEKKVFRTETAKGLSSLGIYVTTVNRAMYFNNIALKSSDG